MVTPAAQPVVISYRRHIRESVLLAAQSLSQRGSEAPEIPLGLGTAPRPGFLRVVMELSYMRPWGHGQNNGPLSSNCEEQAPVQRDFRAMSSYEVGKLRAGSPHSRRCLGLSSNSKPIWWGRGQAPRKASDSLLLILKWDRPMVCLTMLGVTVLIFHRSSFLCSQGSFSTGERWPVWGRKRVKKSRRVMVKRGK